MDVSIPLPLAITDRLIAALQVALLYRAVMGLEYISSALTDAVVETGHSARDGLFYYTLASVTRFLWG